MNVEARLTSTWRNRMLFIALMILGVAAWFFYDGIITWPNEAERYERYRALGEEMVASGDAPEVDSPEVQLAWERLARQEDFSEKVPSERTEEDIAGQFKWGTGVGLVGLAFLGWVFWNQTLRIRSDEDYVYSARGKKVPWGAFTGVDRSKWEKKGIAVAEYELDGKKGRMVLDDYKFAPAEDIIVEIERRLGIEYKSPKEAVATEAAGSETETPAKATPAEESPSEEKNQP
ncbi:MAG: hypothetical protein ACLFU2_13460 [Opitutales bacterium]